jgi:sulfotransferase family protein
MVRRYRDEFVFDMKCRILKTFRAAGRLLKPAVHNRFLFILCPPYAGSTLMHEIICSSSQVSPTNIFGVREGQGLPEIRKIVDYRREWDGKYLYPWPSIKAIWLRYWDTSKAVLMDKSPPNLIRAEAIQDNFDPASFIVMTRNPYAHAEGMMRRNGLSAEAAAEFTLQCLGYQRRNAETLRRRCVIRYEDLVLDPYAVKRRIDLFMPQLNGLHISKLYSAHNHKKRGMPITDFNLESISRLSPEQKVILNRRFANEEALLSFFAYELVTLES